MTEETRTTQNEHFQTRIVHELDPDKPFLTPIDFPTEQRLKDAYDSTRKYLGKVMTPLKVFSARLPSTFNDFYNKISELDNQLVLPREIALLIRAQVARINVCSFCIDANRYASMQISMNQDKIDALDVYQASSLFSDAEHAVLDYVTVSFL